MQYCLCFYKVVLLLVSRRGIKPLSKHSLSCGLTLPRKLLKFLNKNSWTKSGPGDFQFFILPRIFFKLSLDISTFSCFVTMTSFCKFFHPFASLLSATENKLLIWILNKIGPSSGPYGTPKGISDNSLKLMLIFVPCHLLVK